MGPENMMYYGTEGIGGGDIFSLLISLVVLADLILVGFWLWKQINK